MEDKAVNNVSRSKEYVKRFVQIVMILAGITLIVLGIYGGNVTDIWNKAVHICYECIGIG